MIQPRGSEAVTGLGLVGASDLSLDTSSNNVEMQVTPTNDGVLASGSHTVTASTNVSTGYKLSLTTTNLSSLTPSTGSLTAPIALTNNTWGYAINRVSSNTAANTITNGFDANYSVPTPADVSKWADPTTETIIKNTTVTASNDATTIYYGAKADMSLAAGTYNNTVRYTATANLSTIPAPSIVSVSPARGTTAGGTAIAIVGTGFTVNDQSITTAVTISGQNCADVSISSNTPNTGQDTIYCNTPIHPTAASVDVAVTTWHSIATGSNGFAYAAPTPTITTPTAGQILDAGTTSVALTVTTDFAAVCYYGTAANPTTAMTTTGGTTHSVSITGLANQSTNTRYVRCQAASGHSYSADANVTFYVRAVTPAVPTLNPAKDAVVNIGTTTITVTSSGATCTWGTSSGNTTNASGATRTTTNGTNTLYYSCVTGSGNTASEARTGSWSYIGVLLPSVISVSPSTNWTGGDVWITGTRFYAGGSSNAVTRVAIGGTSCSSYEVISDTSIRCVLPYKGTSTTAAYSVVVTTSAGSSNDSVAANYDGVNKGTMQALTTTLCSNMATGLAQIRTDSRNSQTYRVKKMPDGKCWMIDNLKYAYGTLTTSGYLTSDGTTGGGANDNVAKYADPSSTTYCADSGGALAGSTTKCGYLYNWYAATYGTGLGTTTTGNVAGSICPNSTAAGSTNSSPWRLPTGNTGTTSNTTLGDFGVLDKALGGTGAYWSDWNLWNRTWNFTGQFQAVNAGTYSNTFGATGQTAYYRTGGAIDAYQTRQLTTGQNYAYPGNGAGQKRTGFGVRCVMSP